MKSIKDEIDDIMMKAEAIGEASSIIDFYYGSTNSMVAGLVLPLLAIAEGRQLISDEE